MGAATQSPAHLPLVGYPGQLPLRLEDEATAPAVLFDSLEPFVHVYQGNSCIFNLEK